MYCKPKASGLLRARKLKNELSWARKPKLNCAKRCPLFHPQPEGAALQRGTQKAFGPSNKVHNFNRVIEPISEPMGVDPEQGATGSRVTYALRSGLPRYHGVVCPKKAHKRKNIKKKKH